MAKGKPMPFARKAAKPFEKSPRDVEPKGMREGSRAEEAFDRRQAGPPAFRKGGKAGRK